MRSGWVGTLRPWFQEKSTSSGLATGPLWLSILASHERGDSRNPAQSLGTLARASPTSDFLIGVATSLVILWESYKLVWNFFGWIRPVRPDNVVMPHSWDMILELFQPARRGGQILIIDLASRSFWTLREAFLGFIIGGLITHRDITLQPGGE